MLEQSAPPQPQNRSALRPWELSIPWHCRATSNFRIDPVISEIWIQASLNCMPYSSRCCEPQPLPPAGLTSSIPPRTSFPAVSWSLCQHLFCTPEHGWGTAGTICRHSGTLCLADFDTAQPCEGLAEVTSAQAHGSQCCRTAPIGTNCAAMAAKLCVEEHFCSSSLTQVSASLPKLLIKPTSRSHTCHFCTTVGRGKMERKSPS